MKSLDEMSANEAIAIYLEKHKAIEQGDMIKLLELKKLCPDIFDKEKDAEMAHTIAYIKAFQSSERYEELRRLDLKEKLTVISEESAD